MELKISHGLILLGGGGGGGEAPPKAPPPQYASAYECNGQTYIKRTNYLQYKN